jgi:hypothetical protein
MIEIVLAILHNLVTGIAIIAGSLVVMAAVQALQLILNVARGDR